MRDEEPFRPRPRWRVRLRHARAVARRRQPVLLPLVLVLVAAFCFGATMSAIMGVGASTRGVLDVGGTAIIWFFLAVGALALVPFTMERRASPIFKPGALREMLRESWQRLARLVRRGT